LVESLAILAAEKNLHCDHFKAPTELLKLQAAATACGTILPTYCISLERDCKLACPAVSNTEVQRPRNTHADNIWWPGRRWWCRSMCCVRGVCSIGGAYWPSSTSRNLLRHLLCLMYYLLHCNGQISLHCLSHHQLHGSSHLLRGMLHLLLHLLVLRCWHRLRCTLCWSRLVTWRLRWWREPCPWLLCRCGWHGLPKTCNSRDSWGIEATQNTIDATQKALDGGR